MVGSTEFSMLKHMSILDQKNIRYKGGHYYGLFTMSHSFNNRRFSQHCGWVILGVMINYLSSYIANIYFAKCLPLHEYGLFMFSLRMCGLLAPVLLFGTEFTVLKYLPQWR